MSAGGGRAQAWEAVIGLEVHAQLRTDSKLFCGCATGGADEPNRHVCPVCAGYPGVLPVLNGRAVELAIRAGLALGCEVQPTSRFDRKNYFYPDLPKGYQISQYELPICLGGSLTVPTDDGELVVGLTRIHMEEDAGKLVHADGGGDSLVDLNRAGTPLVEIVSEPELHSPAHAAAYMRELRSILRYLDVCDGDMEKGNLRCDANVSVRPRGSDELGTRAEIKNVNSFRYVERAIQHEIDRQIDLIEEGGEVVQETRLFDDRTGTTRSMRSKEDAHDYRYFPEPDLPPIEVAVPDVERMRTSLPVLPAARRARYVEELGLPAYDAGVLTENVETADYFEATLAAGAPAKTASNWIMGEIARAAKETDAEGADPGALGFPPAHLAELIALVDADRVSGSAAKKVLAEALATGKAPAALVDEMGLAQISDDDTLAAEVDTVVEAHPDEVERYRGGATKLLGFFVGQVMKRTKGQANPKRVNELVRARLDA